MDEPRVVSSLYANQHRVRSWVKNTGRSFGRIISVQILPLWFTIFLSVMLLGALVFIAHRNDQLFAEKTAVIQQQQIAAAYTPLLEACAKSAPAGDGFMSETEVSGSARLCVTTMTATDSNSGGTISAPKGAVALVEYTAYPIKGGGDITQSSSSVIVAIAPTADQVIVPEQISAMWQANPSQAIVCYLPADAPRGAESYLASRCLGAYLGNTKAGGLPIAATSSAFGLPRVYSSIDDALAAVLP